MRRAGSLPVWCSVSSTCVQSRATVSSFLSYCMAIVAGDLELAHLVGRLRRGDASTAAPAAASDVSEAQSET